MMILPVRIKHALNVSVQGSHDPDTRENRRPRPTGRTLFSLAQSGISSRKTVFNRMLRVPTSAVASNFALSSVYVPANPMLAMCPALRGLVLGVGKLRDVGAGVLQRDELATARQRYGIVEGRQGRVGNHSGPQPIGA